MLNADEIQQNYVTFCTHPAKIWHVERQNDEFQGAAVTRRRRPQ